MTKQRMEISLQTLKRSHWFILPLNHHQVEYRTKVQLSRFLFNSKRAIVVHGTLTSNSSLLFVNFDIFWKVGTWVWTWVPHLRDCPPSVPFGKVSSVYRPKQSIETIAILAAKYSFHLLYSIFSTMTTITFLRGLESSMMTVDLTLAILQWSKPTCSLSTAHIPHTLYYLPFFHFKLSYHFIELVLSALSLFVCWKKTRSLKYRQKVVSVHSVVCTNS
jgi:hypothetical protein